MPSEDAKRYSVLVGTTLAFTVCVMIWMMFAVIGIPIKQTLGLNETEFALLAATPLLSGSMIRLPLAIWADKFGGRIVLFMLMVSTVIPVYLISMATELWQFLITGLFVGLAGGAFSVGITYVTHWFPENQQGTAMDIFGMGSAGAALTKVIAPPILLAWGWHAVPQLYSALMLGAALLFLFTSHTAHKDGHHRKVTVKAHLAALKDIKVWKYSHYYFIVFGGFMALALWLTSYYISEYGFDIKSAALLATAFSLPAGVLHVIGGMLADKYGAHTVTWWVWWVSLICLFFLSYPPTDFMIHTLHGPETFHIGLDPTAFTILMFTMGTAWAVGKASVFKYIAEDYPHNVSVISGVVGLIGGLGGFVLAVMFGVLVDLTGVRSSAFMLMFGIIWVSLMWMYWTEVRPVKMARHVLLQTTASGVVTEPSTLG